jgi:hypothetical protein
MKRVYRFKSILMSTETPVDDGSAAYGGAPGTDQQKGKITYNLEAAREHVLEAGPAHFLFCRSWIQSFIIALLAVVILSAIAYGFLVIGMKVDFGTPGGALAGKLTILALLLVFIAVLLAVGIPAAVRRIKSDLVVSERGPGAWKIVDAAGWDQFERMLRLAREREEKKAEIERALKGGR